MMDLKAAVFSLLPVKRDSHLLSAPAEVAGRNWQLSALRTAALYVIGLPSQQEILYAGNKRWKKTIARM
jgi:hypothetical protein